MIIGVLDLVIPHAAVLDGAVAAWQLGNDHFSAIRRTVIARVGGFIPIPRSIH